MALEVEDITKPLYFGLVQSKTERDVHTWPLMSINEPLMIVFGYLLFVKALGPAYMKYRKPYNLKTPILWYNAAQVIFSAYLVYIPEPMPSSNVCVEKCVPGYDEWLAFYCSLVTLAFWGYFAMTNAIAPGIPFFDFFTDKCHHKTHSTKKHRIQVATVLWWYLVAKLTELVDTIFFVLRKKYNQVSFFHVYHHATTFFYTWLIMKIGPEEHGLFCVAINSFIHVLMYSYYALAALGPQYQKYTWWKKYMTTLQIIQITCSMIYLILARLSNCNYSVFVTNMVIINAGVLLLLFLNFYSSSYSKKKTV